MSVFGETYRENDQPILVESVVMYADLLGVSEMARSDQALSYLRLIEAAVREVVADWEGKSEFEFATFSDSLLIARPIVDGDYEGALGAIIAAAAVLQARMVHHGILLRGGITLGEFSSQKDLVFGGALVRAARDLEGRFAVFPRILVDRENDRIRELLATPKLGSETAELVLVDQDLWPFVNYFEGGIEFGYMDHAGVAVYLMRHHVLLANQLGEPDLDQGVRAKLVWAANQEVSAWQRLKREYPHTIRFMFALVSSLSKRTVVDDPGLSERPVVDETEWIRAVGEEAVREMRSELEKLKEPD